MPIVRRRAAIRNDLILERNLTMKKTVFLGDSILLEGYGRVIGDRLADVCTCWQPPRNGCFTANTLQIGRAHV